MTGKDRTSLSIDADVLRRAKAQGINLSATAERAIREALNRPTYYVVNANSQRLPKSADYADAYRIGVAATFGPERYGRMLRSIEPDDIVLSYVNDVGIRAVGVVEAPWDGKSLPDTREHRVAPVGTEENEYHVQVRWERVRPEHDAVDIEEFRRITGRTNPPRQAVERLNEEYRPDLLAAIIRGRD